MQYTLAAFALAAMAAAAPAATAKNTAFNATILADKYPGYVLNLPEQKLNAIALLAAPVSKPATDTLRLDNTDYFGKLYFDTQKTPQYFILPKIGDAGSQPGMVNVGPAEQGAIFEVTSSEGVNHLKVALNPAGPQDLAFYACDFNDAVDNISQPLLAFGHDDYKGEDCFLIKDIAIEYKSKPSV